jgi:catechol-2,3-dioxygenase
MAWMMNSLDDLKELYQRLKDRGIVINTVADHGISIGIYFSDPDGSGIEVSYELPLSEWPRKERIFRTGDFESRTLSRPLGR